MVSVRHLKKHTSYPRNRNIASVFYKAGFIESWGRGYKKIREEFEKSGHPVPTVEESDGAVNNEIGAVNSDVTLLIELTARQKRIKELIRIKPTITILQMTLILSIPRRTLQRDLSILQKAGIIRHEGSDKSGIWVVLEPYNKGK